MIVHLVQRVGHRQQRRDDRVPGLVVRAVDAIELAQRPPSGARRPSAPCRAPLPCPCRRRCRGRRAPAASAASLTRLARSAPEKPGVPRAIERRFTSSAIATLRPCTPRIASRPLRSGLPTITWRSKRPGRRSAGSRMSCRFVAAMTTMPARGFEAVHLDEQLVERLLALFVAERAAAAAAADGVELVDEDDAGLVAACVLEQAADARGADAGVHLDEVRAAREDERHAGFTRNRAGEQGLAGSRRSDEQHALGDASADRREALRMAEEVDDLLDLVLRLVHARDVLEGDDLAAALGELRLARRVDAAGGRAVDGEADEREEEAGEARCARRRQARPGRAPAALRCARRGRARPVMKLRVGGEEAPAAARCAPRCRRPA